MVNDPTVFIWEDGIKTFLVRGVLPWVSDPENIQVFLDNFGIKKWEVKTLEQRVEVIPNQKGIDPVMYQEFGEKFSAQLLFIKKPKNSPTEKNGYSWQHLDFNNGFLQLIYWSGIHKGIFMG